MASKFAPLIYSAAKRYQLSPLLIAAIIEQESGGYEWATREEKGFFQKYVWKFFQHQQHLPHFVPTKTNRTTEADDRSRSYGLMQLMGLVARELGFKGEALAELYDPATNLDWGCRHFHNLLERCDGNVERALLRWNGGGRKEYAQEVLSHTTNGRASRHLSMG